MNPILHPDGQTMGCTCKDFEENWSRYNGTALYVSLNWAMVINCSGDGLWSVYWQPIAWLNTNQLVQLDLKEQQWNWNKMPRFSRQCIWKWRLQAESHFTWPICIKSTFYPGHNVLTETTATLIDNILTNNIDTASDHLQGILCTDISDHYAIFLIAGNIEYDETNSPDARL